MRPICVKKPKSLHNRMFYNVHIMVSSMCILPIRPNVFCDSWGAQNAILITFDPFLALSDLERFSGSWKIFQGSPILKNLCICFKGFRRKSLRKSLTCKPLTPTPGPARLSEQQKGPGLADENVQCIRKQYILWYSTFINETTFLIQRICTIEACQSPAPPLESYRRRANLRARE